MRCVVAVDAVLFSLHTNHTLRSQPWNVAEKIFRNVKSGRKVGFSKDRYHISFLKIKVKNAYGKGAFCPRAKQFSSNKTSHNFYKLAVVAV